MSANVVGGYTAEDWEGFEKLVQASNIQDKDVILRVLSMYEDPYEREEQIRNMSQGFRELADGILPELRRSRMVINYEVVGRSDQQIKDQYKADPSKLSVEELLYAAGLESDIDAKQAIYRKTAELYPDDQRAANNVAVMEFAKGNYDAAGRLFQDLAGKKNSVPEAYANLGLIALKDGNIEDAEYLIAKATGAKQIAEALGNLNIAKGNYAEAAENLKNSFNNSSALAELLNKNYTTASVILRNVERKDAMTDYLQAIVNARQGNFDISESFLRSAFQKDPSLKSYAEKDMELIRVKK
jgi:tetratricopeptide (TPR) repeat protein